MDPVLKRLNDKHVLALTLIGEARGESLRGQLGVGLVVGHRVADKRWPNTWRDVCFQPKQFSCWNEDDANYPILVTYAQLLVGTRITPIPPPIVTHMLTLAETLIDGLIPDIVLGANHYFAPSSVKRVPTWAVGKTPVTIIERHAFYKL